jgi:CRISPR/Cas system CSM-associated protein Csm5 (group 7 of RAMP superfamily)
MSYIKAETLTPVHIGTGREFMGNFEYLYFSDTQEIAIIDEKKIYQLIGDEGIEKWVNIIEGEKDLLEYLQARKLTINPGTTGKVMMQVIGRKSPQKTEERGKVRYPNIREYIRSGNGDPILPGSSIKGSIRTAYFTDKVYQNKGRAARITESKIEEIDRDKRKKKFADSRLQKSLIGADPNHDIFRLLRVGDFHFTKTVCVLSESVNLRGNGNYTMLDGTNYSKNASQFVEALPANSVSFGQISFPESLKKEIQQKVELANQKLKRLLTQNLEEERRQSINTNIKKQSLLLSHLPGFDLTTLFSVINQHTQRLLEYEIEYWSDKQLPEEASGFISQLQKLLEKSKSCDANSCVLRVGFGSGFKSMTGDWQEDILGNKSYQQLVDNIRLKKYSGMDFPKSRRMAMAEPMGFLKLTVLSDQEYHLELAKSAELEKQAKLEEQQRIQQLAQAQKEAEQQAQAQAAAEKEARRKAVEEALKPVYFQGKIKKGDVIDAYYIGPVDRFNPKVKMFKLLIGEPGKEQEVQLSYFAEPDKDLVHQVMVSSVTKRGKVESIQYKGIKS